MRRNTLIRPTRHSDVERLVLTVGAEPTTPAQAVAVDDGNAAFTPADHHLGPWRKS